MAVQQNFAPDLLIDGYISNMFGPKGAEEYHASLLGREPQHIQWFTILPEVPDIFFATPPPRVQSGQQGWAIDYVIKNTGPVIPQQIWTPRKSADAQRYVYNEQLQPPIFFIHKDGRGLGLSLMDAAGGNSMSLRGADQPAGVGTSTHAQIRIKWRGYQYLDWNDQIMTQMGTPPREPISLGKFAKYVAGRVLKFMEEAKIHTYDDDRHWLIGDHHITPRHVVLIGVVQVSQGSWMPILQLNDGFTLRCGI